MRRREGPMERRLKDLSRTDLLTPIAFLLIAVLIA
jgi:hypothetical protein